VALDRALEALADRDPGDLDPVAGLKGVDGDRLADLELRRAPELDQVTVRRDAGLLEVAELPLRQLPVGDRIEGELDGLVAVVGSGPHLDDRARARLDHGDRGDVPRLRVEDLGHAELASEDALHDDLRAGGAWLAQPGAVMARRAITA
jgi:hypothetical protein